MQKIHASMLLLFVACGRSQTADIEPSHAKELLINRNWIDRMPEQHDDHLFVYRFVPDMGGGVFQDRTVFKGTFELFKFEATGNQIRFVFPHERERSTSGYRIERVDGPAPFDLKLTIDDSPRGPEQYFGIRAETSNQQIELDAQLRKLTVEETRSE